MKASEFAAHAPDEALNQPPALENYNLFASDTPLGEAIQREGGGWIAEQAHEFGEILGRAETLRLGELANRRTPELRTHDRFGRRIDEVEFHPAWHELMRLWLSYGSHSLPWTSDKSGAHAARAALMMLRNQGSTYAEVANQHFSSSQNASNSTPSPSASRFTNA